MHIRQLRAWLLRLVGIFGREARDRELAEELEIHLQMHMEDNVRAGMNPQEARRQALIKLGGVAQTNEEYRRQWGFPMLGDLWQDMRFGARVLLKQPAFTLVAVLTLALGIGANTAIFSVVNAVLLRPLPYRDSQQLVVVWEKNRPRARERNVANPSNFLEWQAQAQSFKGMAAFYDTRFNLTGAGEPVEVPVQVASGNLFTVLGADAMLGRTFAPEDAEPGHHNVVILSHGFWQSQFGGARDIVGKSIALNGEQVQIIGVMSPDFRWFIKENSLGVKPSVMWTPTKFTPQQTRGRFISVVGRLRPSVSFGQARAEMDTIASRLEQKRPDFNTGWGVTLVPVREQLAGELKTPLMILLGAVGFVLLIACANVANLQLARAAARSKEIAIRMALGARASDVLRLVVGQGMRLTLAGVMLGLVGAFALTRVISGLLFGVSATDPVTFVGVALLLTTSALMACLVPARRAARVDPMIALRAE
jgi:hypothetical protein